MSGLWAAAFVTLWALVIALALLTLGALRRLVPLLERAEESLRSGASASLGGLAPGTAVRPFMAREVAGRTFTEDDLLGSTSVVLFVGADCRSCERLVDDLRSGAVPELEAPLFVVASAELAESLSHAVTVLADDDRVIAEAFDSRLVPHAFVLDQHGTVLAVGRPNDWGRLRHLLATAKGGDREAKTSAAAVAP